VETFRKAWMLDTKLISKIYYTYVHPGAQREVPLHQQTREKLVQDLKKPTKHIFDEAQEEVFLFLFKDHYRRFMYT